MPSGTKWFEPALHSVEVRGGGGGGGGGRGGGGGGGEEEQHV